MTETRRLALHSPVSASHYAIDWELTFDAHEKAAVLDRTPITQETPWGGYAGLSWRATRDMSGFKMMNSERQTTLVDMNRKQAHWGALWGQLDGGWNQWGGMAMFDHPDNPRHPSYWYYIGDPGFGYLNPAFLQEEPFTLQPGNPLHLRYRVLVFEGEPTYEFLEEEYNHYLPLTDD